MVPHDVASAARERLAERVGPGEHGRAAREQNERRRRVAELFDPERDAVGLDRRHEPGPGALTPSGVRNERTVGFMRCVVCIVPKDRAQARNSSPCRTSARRSCSRPSSRPEDAFATLGPAAAATAAAAAVAVVFAGAGRRDATRPRARVRSVCERGSSAGRGVRRVHRPDPARLWRTADAAVHDRGRVHRRLDRVRIWASGPWRSELEEAIGPVMAWVIPVMLAYIPAIVIGFLCFTLMFTRYRPPRLDAPAGRGEGDWPPVTVDRGRVQRGGRDRRDARAHRATAYPARSRSCWPTTTRATERPSWPTAAGASGSTTGGASSPRRASTTRSTRRSATVTTPLVVTVDADTLLHAGRAHLPDRARDEPPPGPARVRMRRRADRRERHDNFLTRMQGWDYRLGINGVKRTQAAYNSALVAQGAFSAYWTDDIRAVGGWPDAIGEDIVLTWRLMDSRGIVQYEPVALAATVVPEQLKHFMRQRSRWARGMLEGIRSTRPSASRACWPSSSPGSTTSCRCSTSATCSSGSPA